MTSDAQEMLDLFLERIGQAHDIAIMTTAIVTTLRSLLLELSTWHDANALAQDVIIAEEEARKALELWDRFWSIEAPPTGDAQNERR